MSPASFTATPVPAASTICRSPTLVPVGPVRIRPPSALKNDHESLACSARPASRPRPRARAIVSRLTRAPAASVGPSTPSVPMLAATVGRPLILPCHREREGELLVAAADALASHRHRRLAGGEEAHSPAVARQLVRQPLGVRAGRVAGFAGDRHVADDDLIAEAPRHRGGGVHGVDRRADHLGRGAQEIGGTRLRCLRDAPLRSLLEARDDGHGIGSPAAEAVEHAQGVLKRRWHRPRSAPSQSRWGRCRRRRTAARPAPGHASRRRAGRP